MIEQIKIDVLDIDHITNCYIIWDEESKEAVIVDPADKSFLIEQRVEELGVKPQYVLLTHGHIDHTIALNRIMKKYSIKTIAGINEKGMLEGIRDDCSQRYGLEQVKYDMDDFIHAKDDFSFQIGNMSFKVISTPGHTKGCVCYYIEDNNILITGDTLFYNCFGRCDLDTSSLIDMYNSLKKIYRKYRTLNPHIYPGHGKIDVPLENTYDEVRVLMYNNYKLDIGGYDESF